jgi:hypothetical protein
MTLLRCRPTQRCGRCSDFKLHFVVITRHIRERTRQPVAAENVRALASSWTIHTQHLLHIHDIRFNTLSYSAIFTNASFGGAAHFA